MNKKLLITIVIALFLIAGTTVAIYFAKGYRLNLKKKKVQETGLLVANSNPEGASVYLDGKLTTATDDTLNLPPKDYRVKIIKDGYLPWEKVLTIEKELVKQTEARLFPAAPDLKALTFTGALDPIPSPDGEKIAFVVASASASPKNGLWITDLVSRPLLFTKNSKQIAANTTDFDFTNCQLVWSPDSKEVLALNENHTFLLNIDNFNDLTTQPEATARLSLILDDWEEELALKKEEQFKKLPQFMEQIATSSAKNIYFSPDEEKLLYTATASATLPEGLLPQLPASNDQPETRIIEASNIYVYDLKEDKNFHLTSVKENKEKEKSPLQQRLTKIQNQYSASAVQPIQWFPTSRHLILTGKDKIIILEYDGTNQTSVYAGPFEDSFVYPWPDGSKLLILASLNPQSDLPANLYVIDLK